ncbi:hypothetical protein IT412_03950 [Candidatus Peregrinibacteria bacterium]|nr:hypothetical protein [Candidatus Peregrinibacteria bacterium]
MGECTVGTQSCDNTGHWTACSGIAPTVEACDGLDNNCDGLKDNNCPCITGATMPCGENLGICTAGTQTCVNGSWGPCSGVTPTQEKCATLLDENCNGLTDEPGCTP